MKDRDNMAFDPKKYGAIPIEEFDPSKYGVVPVKSNANSMTQHQSIESLKTQQAQAEKEAGKGLFGRFLKGLPSAAVEVNIGGPARLGTSLAEGITTGLKTGGKTTATGKTYDLPGLQPFQSFQTEADKKAQEGVSPLRNIASTGAKVGLAGLETIGLAKGITKTVKGASALNNARNNAKIWNLVQPKLTSLEQAEAVKAGQVAKTFTGKIKQVPNQEMIDVARLHLKTTDPIKATKQLQEGIVREANAIRDGLKQSKAIWNRNELKGAIAKIERPHLLSGDIEKAYIKTLQATLKEAEKASKTLDGLLDVRRNFDRIVAKQYPNLYESDNLTPIKSAVLETRRAINKLIEAKLPETADKTAFVQSLRRQSLLYDAIDNVATKVPKVGSTALSRFAQRHSGIIKGLKWVGGGVAAGLGIKSLQNLGE